MFRWFGRCFRTLRRRWRSVLVGTILLLVLLVAGGHAWASYQFTQAQTAMAEDRLDDARRDLWWCLRLWPRSTATRLLAARVERLAQNYPAASRYIHECQALDQSTAEATQLEMVCLRAEGGDLDELEPGMWEAAKKKGPDAPVLLEALARASFRAHRLTKTLLYLHFWLEQDPTSGRAYMLLGTVLEQRYALEAARGAYRKALEVQPARWRARLRLAMLHLQEKQTEEAAPLLEQLWQEHHEDPEVALALARWYILRSKDREAVELLQQVLAQGPTNADALLLRGQLACDARHPEEGETWFKKALDVHPKDPDVLWAYYRCLQQQGGRQKEATEVHARYQDMNKALGRLMELLRLDLEGQLNDAGLRTEVGDLFQKLGHERQAVEFYYRALELDPKCVAAHRALMELFTKDGNAERAARHRQALERLQPKPSSP
jgi:tetratricopeptide (TPR) repeat protein